MRKAIFKTSIILIATIVFTVCFCAVLSHATQTAYADEPAHFTILTEDGTNWELRYETATIRYATGDFYGEESDPTTPRNLFREEILAQLALLSKDADDYVLSFVLPKPTIYFLNGIDSNPYTDADDSMIVVETDYSDMLSTNEAVLEYRTSGQGDFAVFPVTDPTALRFGKGVAKGDYEVRAVITKRFDYFGRHYEPQTTSDPLVCHITGSSIPDENIEIPSLPPFEYGMTLAEIAQAVSDLDQNGTWTVSAGQNADYRPVASDEQRIVRLDFQSINVNYDANVGLQVPILVKKRRLEVYIGDVNVLVGASLVQTFEYSVESTLAAGDTLESIGFSVSAQNVNVNVAGTYPIRASVTSGNYEVVNRNYESTIFMGGKYIVHAKGIVVHTSDYREVTFEREEGFIGYTIEFTPISKADLDGVKEELYANPDSNGLTLVGVYVLQITDSNGVEVVDMDGIRVTLTQKDNEYAVAYFANGEWVFVRLEDMGFDLVDNARVFAIFKQTPVPYYRTEEWNAGLTATCVLIILFAVATWIVVIIAATKRRILK